jgi:hypothetical protein
MTDALKRHWPEYLMEAAAPLIGMLAAAEVYVRTKGRKASLVPNFITKTTHVVFSAENSPVNQTLHITSRLTIRTSSASFLIIGISNS